MKVALAFFGQPRGLEEKVIIDQWKTIITDSIHDIDVYAHFWDTVSNVTVSETYEEFVKEESIDSGTHFTDFWNEIKPINVDVQNAQVVDEMSHNLFFNNEYIYKRVDPSNPNTGRATLGQWHSTERVLNQVIESGIEYDVVVRIRADIIFADVLSGLHRPFDRNVIEDFYNRKTSHRCIGSPNIKVIRGTPIINDWFTTMEGSFVKEFNHNLTQNIGIQFNSIFAEPDDPISIQEYALHKHCMKRGIDAISTLTNAKIYRKTDDVWHWPNYSI